MSSQGLRKMVGTGQATTFTVMSVMCSLTLLSRNHRKSEEGVHHHCYLHHLNSRINVLVKLILAGVTSCVIPFPAHIVLSSACSCNTIEHCCTACGGYPSLMPSACSCKIELTEAAGMSKSGSKLHMSKSGSKLHIGSRF